MSTMPMAAPARPTTTPKKRRIVGVDIARGLAIAGMFVAHLGMERSTDFFTTTGWFWLADGRPSALFATLAGLGLAFMTKRAYATGDDAEYAVQRTRIWKRSAILMVLGWLLGMLVTPVAVILGAYAVLFVLAMPFLRMRPTALLACAATVALVMPTVVLLTRYALLGATSPHEYVYNPAGAAALLIPIVADLWSGYYPALSWVLYILVGLAIGRMQLRKVTTQLGLLVGGIAAAAAGYLPGLALERSTTGLVQDLVTIEPHADTTFEMVGNVGFAVALLALCLLLTTAIAPIRVVLTPITAMGSMSLTIYAAHIVYIRVLGNDAVFTPTSNWPLIWLTIGSMVFATIWHLTLQQGPMERLLHRMIRPRQQHPVQQVPVQQGQVPPWAGGQGHGYPLGQQQPGYGHQPGYAQPPAGAPQHAPYPSPWPPPAAPLQHAPQQPGPPPPAPGAAQPWQPPPPPPAG